jgi:molybdopterin-guanine dinucleotide biosynthesis protein B
VPSGKVIEMTRYGKRPPVVCVVGASGVGKTTLLEKLIPELRRRGVKVATVKHDVHGFQMDRPGKDSWRHKQAGAAITLISSPFQIGMVRDVDHDHSLDELSWLTSSVDIVLTEGYKREQEPKIEVFRPEVRNQPLCKDDSSLFAMVSDAEVETEVPRYSPQDAVGLAELIITRFGLKSRPPGAVSAA